MSSCLRGFPHARDRPRHLARVPSRAGRLLLLVEDVRQNVSRRIRPLRNNPAVQQVDALDRALEVAQALVRVDSVAVPPDGRETAEGQIPYDRLASIVRAMGEI